MRYPHNACLKRLVEPEEFGEAPTWKTVRAFKCDWRPTSAEQNIRAGRENAQRGVRIFYRPVSVRVDVDCRVVLDGREYEVVYAEPPKNRLRPVYADCVDAQTGNQV